MSEEEFTYSRSAYIERPREIACDSAKLLMQDAVPAGALLEGRQRSVPR